MEDTAPENASEQEPPRLFLDIVFWVGNASFLLFALNVVLRTEEGAGVLGYAIFPVILCYLIFPFLLGGYLSRFGRNGVVWGILSFITAPLGFWVGYVTTFFLMPKDS